MNNVTDLNSTLFKIGEAVNINRTGLDENNQTYNLNITQLVV